MNQMQTYSDIESCTHALICPRISDKKQLKGSGLKSQEHRCRQRAAELGLPVEEVFEDVVSGGDDLFDRPSIQSLLAYLDRQRGSGRRYLVIFDDHKRFARNSEMHLKLKRLLGTLGAKIQYLNLKMEDSPEGRFVETVFAAQSQLEREQNARQVRDKTIARLEQGYWTFRAPVGYRYVRAKGGGMVLVCDEAIAPIIHEAYAGYAAGRFGTISELKRFLEAQPLYPKDTPDGAIRYQTVVRLLSRVLYAGYLEVPNWKISLRKAKHEPIVLAARPSAIDGGRVRADAQGYQR